MSLSQWFMGFVVLFSVGALVLFGFQVLEFKEEHREAFRQECPGLFLRLYPGYIHTVNFSGDVYNGHGFQGFNETINYTR